MIEDQLRHRALFRLIFRVRLDGLQLQRIDSCITRTLVLRHRLECCTQCFGVLLAEVSHHFGVQLDRSYIALLNLERFVQFLLPTTETIDLFVGHHQGLNHDLFRNFIGAGFDHNNRFFSSRDNQVQTRFTHFIVSRINDVASFDQADAHARNRIQERDIGQEERTRRTCYRNHVGIVVGIGGDDTGNNLSFVSVTFSEEWATGTVDQTAGEHLLFVRTAFTTEVIAGNTSGSVVRFTVFDRERKKVDAFASGLSADGRHQQHRVAITDHDRSVRLLGDLTGFDGQLSFAELD